MARVTKRFLGLALAGIISIGSLATVASELSLSKMVQAQEKAEYSQLRSSAAYYQIKSSQGNTAYNKVKHIITSIQKNYAGIKNQPTWQGYIKEARALIKKIPSKYSQDSVELTKIVDDLEHFVNYVAKMNHVEKSYETQYKGIKNTDQWVAYLNEALEEARSITWYYQDLQGIATRYEEVSSRYSVIASKVNAIINAHYADLEKIGEKYDLALKTGNLALAEEALADANKLGTHSTTTVTKNAIIELINSLK